MNSLSNTWKSLPSLGSFWNPFPLTSQKSAPWSSSSKKPSLIRTCQLWEPPFFGADSLGLTSAIALITGVVTPYLFVLSPQQPVTSSGQEVGHGPGTAGRPKPQAAVRLQGNWEALEWDVKKLETE